jgi:predicted nucleic acid-binding protein
VFSDAVLEVVERTRLSAYDAEFVALSKELSVPLVTEDKAVLKAFPETARSMEGFLG